MNNTTRILTFGFVLIAAFMAGRLTNTATATAAPEKDIKQTDDFFGATVNFDKKSKDRNKRNEPISFGTVMSYRDAYNQHPILRDSNHMIIKGFTIDNRGVAIIRDSLHYKQIYIRFGRKPNGDYTLMLLPLDDSGDLIQNGANPSIGANYDNLEPCPDECPKNFGMEQRHDQR